MSSIDGQASTFTAGVSNYQANVVFYVIFIVIFGAYYSFPCRVVDGDAHFLKSIDEQCLTTRQCVLSSSPTNQLAVVFIVLL